MRIPERVEEDARTFAISTLICRHRREFDIVFQEQVERLLKLGQHRGYYNAGYYHDGVYIVPGLSEEGEWTGKRVLLES